MESVTTMTEQDRAAARQMRLDEPGTEPPCPFCQRPRVLRSDYIRCNLCGVNWLNGEDLSKDPRIQRKREWMATMATAYPKTATASGARPAPLTSD